jgi:phage/plasmid-like protein (TIGR03299 family)
MAHNIEITNGKASFVENGRKARAWHKLGMIYDRPLSVKEALHGCRADYKVVLQPLVALTPDIQREMDYGSVMALQLNNAIVPKYMATMRLDTHRILGLVSENYGIVQNEDAFKFIDTLVTGKMADVEHTPVIETAGVLGEGERVFITAKFPEQIILDNKGNDRVEMYIVFTTSHDGTGAVNCLVTPIRVVCNNTLNFAMKYNSGKLSLRHSRNVMDRLDLRESENAEFVYKTLNMYDVYKNSLEAEFKHLQNIKLAEQDLMRILAEITYEGNDLKIFRESKYVYDYEISKSAIHKINKMRDIVESGIGQNSDDKGSAMWLINGITSYFQNYATYKSDETKFENIQNGSASRKLQMAYDLISVYTK